MGTQAMIKQEKIVTIIPIISATLFIIFSLLLFQQASLKIVPYCDVDSKAYIAAGKVFYEHGSFASLESQPYYSLGYALFIGLLARITHHFSLVLIIIAQIILSLTAGFMIYRITKDLFGVQPARISWLLFSCNLGFLVFTQFILTEILLALMLLTFFQQCTSFIIRNSWWDLVRAGVVLGASTIVKPAAIYYPFGLSIIIICALWNNGIPRIIGALTLFFVAFYLPIVGYSIHNKYVFNTYSTGSLGTVNTLFWFLPHVLAEENNTTSDIERVTLKEIERDSGIDEVKKILLYQIIHNPFRVAYVWLKNTMKTWLGLYAANLKILVDNDIYSGQYSFFRIPGSLLKRTTLYVTGNTSLLWVKVVSTLECIWQGMRYLLVLIAGYQLIRLRRWTILLLFLSFLGYFSLITGHDGCARFRMMFEGQLIILSAYGIWILISNKGHGNEEPVRWNSCRRKRLSAMAPE